MKTQYRIFSAVIAFAILLSGCSVESGEADSKLTEGEALTVSSDITAAPATLLSDNTPESSEAPVQTSKTVQSEKVTGIVAENIPVNTYTAEFPPSGIDMSNYGGHFYEWEYDKSIVSEDESDFAPEDIKVAHLAAEEYFIGLLKDAEKKDEVGGYGPGAVIELDIPGYDRSWEYRIYEDDYIKCMNGECEIEFCSGAHKDFDGDGKEESFFVFEKNPYMNLPIYLAVFVNAKGEARALRNAGLNSGGLYPIIYNRSTHMAISSGYNNTTMYAEIYAVENGEAVLKLTEFSLPENYMDVFMRVYMVQRTGEWLVFWNDEINEYCSVSGDPITDVEAESLFDAYKKNSFSIDEYFGRYKTAEAIKNNARKISNIYSIAAYDGYYPFFEKSEDGFIVSENMIAPADKEFSEIYASSIDFDTIAEKTIALQ